MHAQTRVNIKIFLFIHFVFRQFDLFVFYVNRFPFFGQVYCVNGFAPIWDRRQLKCVCIFFFQCSFTSAPTFQESAQKSFFVFFFCGFSFVLFSTLMLANIVAANEWERLVSSQSVRIYNNNKKVFKVFFRDFDSYFVLCAQLGVFGRNVKKERQKPFIDQG